MSKRPSKQKPASSSTTPPLFPRLHEKAQAWWAPAAFFLLLSIVYFAEFVFTDHVLMGADLGRDLHRISELSFWDLFNLPVWSNRMGGMPMTGVRVPHYFPVRFLLHPFAGYFQTVGWCYLFAMFSAGWFSFLCIRAMGCHSLAALIGGAVYASSPILLTFTAAGHEAKMLVIALFPLMLWGLFRGLDTKKPIYFLGLAGAIGFGIYTPHLQMLYYALWGVGFCFIWFTAAHYLEDRNARDAGVRTALSAGALALGLGIGAMGLFPQYVYTKTESSRAGTAGEGSGLAYAQSWSLHPEELAALVVPSFLGSDESGRSVYWGRNPFKLNYEYLGLVVLFFAAVALARIRTDKRVLPLSLLALIAICFALGPHTPLHAFFYETIPGNKVLRTPGMIAFLFAMPIALLSAIGLHTVLVDEANTRERAKRIAVGSGITFVILLGASVAPEAALGTWTSLFWSDIPAQRLQMAHANLPEFSRGAGFAAFLVAAIFLLTWFRLQGRLAVSQFALLLLPLILFDTWRFDRGFLNYVDPDDQATVEATFPDVIDFIRSKEGRWRVLSEANLPKDIDAAKVADEQFALQRYDQMVTYLHNYGWFGRGLDLLNIRYVVSRGGLPNRSDLNTVLKANGLVVQENPNHLPRFYLAPHSRVITSPEKLLKELVQPHVSPEKTVLLETPPSEVSLADVGDPSKDRLEEVVYDEKGGRIVLNIEVDGPRFLILCENFHPNWHATLDGEPRTIYRAQYVWRAVQIPRGSHRLEFRYEDPLASACRWISALSFFGWLGALGALKLRRTA